MSKKPGIKPSELVLLAIHNLNRDKGVLERDIVKFICLKLKLTPDKVKSRVKSALARSMTLKLVTQANGRYKLFDVKGSSKGNMMPPARRRQRKKEGRQLLRRGRLRRKYRNPEPVPHRKPVTRCKCCGRRKRVEEMEEELEVDNAHRDIARKLRQKPPARWW